MYELPKEIMINKQSWAIRNGGDYRVVLDCFLALEDFELTKEERILSALIIFYEDLNSVEDVFNLPDLECAYKEMVKFFNCGQAESYGSNINLIDWESDSTLIMSAINNVAGKEVRSEEYVHWWTFMGYYVAIGECPLSNIVGIRYKRAKGKKLEKYEKDFVRDNPQYFMVSHKTDADMEAEEWVRQQWEGGK